MWDKVVDACWGLYDLLENFIKFSLVGMVGVAINFTILYLLTEKAELWYLVSATIGILSAGTSNYLMNHYWTFKKKQKCNTNLFKGWLKYMTAVSLTECLYLGLMYLFTSVAGIYYLLSAFFSLALTTGLRYWSAEKWVWQKKKAIDVVH